MYRLLLVLMLFNSHQALSFGQDQTVQHKDAAKIQERKSLTIAYIERPPYFYTQFVNGEAHAQGFFTDYTRQLLAATDRDAEFVSWPFQRIMSEIKRNQRPLCTMGFYRNPQRQRFALFSRQIYRDPPIAALFLRKNRAEAKAYPSLASIYQNPQMTVGFMKDYSYGAEVDRINQTYRSQQQLMLGKERQLLRLLVAGKIHFILVAPPEIEYMIRAAELDPQDFESMSLADIRRGNSRYLMCSKSVSSAYIAQLNEAILAQPLQFPTLNP